MVPIDRGVCSAFGSVGAGECTLCRHFIVAPELNELKARSARMLIQKAKLTWIAFGGRSFQSHKRLPKLLLIAKNVPRGMLVSLRDFRTWISASDPRALQPESFAGKGKRLLMQHLLQDDVQLHSSCTIQTRLLLIRQATSAINPLFGRQTNSFHNENLQMDPLRCWDMISLWVASKQPQGVMTLH